jgi:hypothetical protein
MMIVYQRVCSVFWPGERLQEHCGFVLYQRAGGGVIKKKALYKYSSMLIKFMWGGDITIETNRNIDVIISVINNKSCQI